MEEVIKLKQTRILKYNEHLLIYKKWEQSEARIMVVFSVIWTIIVGFIASGFLGIFESVDNYFSGPNIMILAFSLIPISFLLFGLGLFYAGLAHVFNKTTIKVDQNYLYCHSGPIPIVRTKKIPLSSIQQIYVHEQGSRSHSNTQNNRFQISFIDQLGASQSLIGQIPLLSIALPTFNLEDAQMIEIALEDFIGIKDQKVAAEYGHKEIAKSKEEEIEASNKEYWNRKHEIIERPLESKQEEMPHPSAQITSTLLAHPENLVVEESIDGLFILKKWKNPQVYFFAIFGLIWNIAIWAAASSFITTTTTDIPTMLQIIPLLFFLPFIGVGLYFIYITAAAFFNSTHIFINANDFKLAHRPFYMGKSIHLKRADITNITSREEVRSSKNGRYTVQIIELTTANERCYPISGGQFLRWTKEEAQFIKHKVSDYLQIST